MMIIQEERGWPAAPGTSPGDSRVQLTFHRRRPRRRAGR